MSNIDTSTTAGKIAVMQAAIDGENIELCFLGRDGCWTDLNERGTQWNWDEYDYRVEPQTIEEAAEASAKDSGHKHTELNSHHYNGFLKGAQWQKDQDNE